MPDPTPPSDDLPTQVSDATRGGVPPFVPPATGGEQPGDWIGPYKLLKVIGEGGFGVVWLAERREPMVQRVALKIIKPGMDSKAVIARFEQERRTLAVMDHPNVAKVFDGGVTSLGRPYFVMEYVKGEPITAFADRHRLDLHERLELFIPVCEAVQHAHIKAIIHRDLKPSNILVAWVEGESGDRGGERRGLVVKVIDFGVAKAVSHTLTDSTVFTERGQIIGTPEYMSPEQAEMGAVDIDARTDVYSLGVVLYELLSGFLPFDAKTLRSAGYAEIQRIIREVDPPKPSTKLSTADDLTGAAIAKARQDERERIARELRKELEWIPMKALRKDRRERYDTPGDLAQDVRRYLKGEPLEAGPESAAYRLRKTLRRYKGPVAAVAAVMVALVAGFGTAIKKATDEAAAKAIAETKTAEAQQERDKANEATKLAKKSADEAIAERRKADEARKAAEFEAYVANLIAADASLAANEPARVRSRLDACPSALQRNWEWKWLNSRSDNSLAVLRGHQSDVWSAAFSPDGTRVVTASRDKTARVWDASSGKEVAVLRGHEDWVRSAAFSPDGTRVVTASGDKTARVWDASSGKEVAVLRGHEDWVRSAAFSPDGTRVVTASMDNTARVWDSVPYRERFLAIDAARMAEARVRAKVQSRIAAGESVEAVRASAIADASISEVERRAFLIVTTELAEAALIGQRKSLAQARGLNASLWPRVVTPVIDATQAADIASQAEQLLAIGGDQPDHLNTVGVAMFRVGKHEQAIEVLQRSDALYVKAGRGEQPSDWAFIAMARWQLGRKEEAREAAAKFRTLAAKAPWSTDKEVKGWVKEVDALIGPE